MEVMSAGNSPVSPAPVSSPAPRSGAREPSECVALGERVPQYDERWPRLPGWVRAFASPAYGEAILMIVFAVLCALWLRGVGGDTTAAIAAFFPLIAVGWRAARSGSWWTLLLVPPIGLVPLVTVIVADNLARTGQVWNGDSANWFNDTVIVIILGQAYLVAALPIAIVGILVGRYRLRAARRGVPDLVDAESLEWVARHKRRAARFGIAILAISVGLALLVAVG